jgi:hypothetical protein
MQKSSTDFVLCMSLNFSANSVQFFKFLKQFSGSLVNGHNVQVNEITEHAEVE